LNEFFSKNNLKIKSIITQKKFLENMGILERAKIISKRMNFSEQSDLYFRLRRLLSPSSMGNLFKVILAYKLKKDNFAGF
jgi:cyclopropane-fatty-acyl-phospholipid synthase